MARASLRRAKEPGARKKWPRVGDPPPVQTNLFNREPAYAVPNWQAPASTGGKKKAFRPSRSRRWRGVPEVKPASQARVLLPTKEEGPACLAPQWRLEGALGEAREAAGSAVGVGVPLLRCGGPVLLFPLRCLSHPVAVASRPQAIVRGDGSGKKCAVSWLVLRDCWGFQDSGVARDGACGRCVAHCDGRGGSSARRASCSVPRSLHSPARGESLQGVEGLNKCSQAILARAAQWHGGVRHCNAIHDLVCVCALARRRGRLVHQ